ncbi:hypothetical protein C900_04646 [Fulvivirga imtechensis AK7]|uniref:Phosphatidate phosphatase APP1 catalytic domain-containing protein n=1 Tax=Fulvivirga imtechensis AK7 TaxID=1237149 RepID=L8JQQ2_9BACT|nr:phosphatase domain-containing protein [Fulvivirga imtechensis]ELR69799.1 hypothetical protein C900_04646 [Fulvivirga imtechensis AK7]
MLSPPVILPYRGYGTQKIVHIRGHVLDDRVLYEAFHDDKRRKNIRAMISRYVSSPIPDIRVEVNLFGHDKVMVTDPRGYFETTFRFKQPLSQAGWHKVRYKVLDKIVEEQEELEIEDEVYIHHGGSSYGIISDVDDTILISHATQVFRKLRLILTKNSKTRLPFTGVAAFYHALQNGPEADVTNPIFYVSSSEWNLYDFLDDFCKVRSIPKGPFLLQDLKVNLWKLIKSGGGTHIHKLEKIRHLMVTFADLSFILIGDSGQHDSLLYAEITKEFPGRVKAIYIRDVSSSNKDKKINRIASELKEHDVEMLLVTNTAEAAKHAFENGWITKDELEKVIKETHEEEQKAESLAGQLLERDPNQKDKSEN